MKCLCGCGRDVIYKTENYKGLGYVYGHNATGKHYRFTEEQKQYLRKPKSEEHKKSLKIAQNRPDVNERRAKSISGERNGMFGKLVTEKQKKGLIKGQKSRVRFTWIHKRLVQFVEELGFVKGIDFEIEFTVNIQRNRWRLLDIAFPKLMIDLEADGEHYHENVEEDSLRDNQLRNLGWSTYRFTGSEIYQGEIVKRRLKEILVEVR